MTKQAIRLAHSPDPDDAFMFYGLASGAVDSGSFEFEHILRDIQTLNEWARRSRLEVTAVSVHAYAYVKDSYAILRSGASMGATRLARYVPEDPNQHTSELPTTEPGDTVAHGPLLIAAEPLSLSQLAGKTIAIPGEMTTAFLVLQLVLGHIDYRMMMFDEIPTAVQQRRVDAGLIIHEGQLTYRRLGLHCVLDLGLWWFEQTRLPLPLGCNVIRRDLGDQVMHEISNILTASIEYGLAHRNKAVRYALQFGRGLDEQLADEFIGMYVNEWTLDYGPVGRNAITELLRRGADAQIIPPIETIDFI